MLTDEELKQALDEKAPATEEEPEEESQIPAKRRDRILMQRRRFANIPVKTGSEQAGAIRNLIDEFTGLAELIEVRCSEGRSKRTALDLLLQAKMLAVHAVTHRGDT